MANQSTTMDNTTFGPNVTEEEPPQLGYYPNGKPVGIIILLFCIATVIANAILIVSYYKCPNLHTRFNVYILNLSIGDLLHAASSGWANMELYYSNGWYLGKVACTLYIYLYYSASLFLFHIHLLISINRLWAVTSPLTYKQYHTKKLAVISCLALWLYAHAWILPALIPDHLFYREDTTLDCSFNSSAQPGWSLWCSYIGYDVPIVLIIVIYPAICWKFWQYREGYLGRKLRSRVTPSGLSRSNGPNTSGKASEPLRSFVDPQPKVTSQADPPVKPGRHHAQNPSKVFHFKIISCLVFGVIICWVPLCSTYIVATVSPDYYTMPYIAVSNVLYYFNPLLNPIIYPLTSNDWRVAFRKTLGLKV